MSYKKARARVYACEVCGRTVTLVPERRGYQPPRYWLPEGWLGGYRKRDVCMCPECSRAIRDEAERRGLLRDYLRYAPIMPLRHDDTPSDGEVTDE